MSRFALVPLAGALLLAASAAQAGSGAGAVTGRLTIDDSAGYAWSLNFDPLLRIDAGTGNVVVNTDLGVNGVDDGQGLWTSTANTAGLVVYNAKGVAFKPSTVVQWHSWLRADGSVGSDNAGGTNPWRSSFSFYAAGNVDPDMSYGFVARNNTGSTQTYTYTQGESIVPPVGGAYSIYADLSGSVNNNTTVTPSLTLAPTAANGNKVQQLWLGNGNAAATNAGVGVGDALTVSAAGTATYGTFAATNAGSGAYDYWEFQTQFTLTGGRDLAQVTGYAEITPVPEPSTYVLLALGLGLIGVQIRRHPR